MADATVKLNDCYEKLDGRVYMRGLQALARIPMAQIRRDRQAGLKTSGFISGYRGSPLAVFDRALTVAESYLQDHDIHFQPAINEELAATMVWGSQQSQLSPKIRNDGVIGLWYGKGPGLDRCGDVFKHANAAGSSPHGGVLCLVGDDHGAKSSTVPHQSDHAFMSAIIPMLYPSSVYEFISYGLIGIAMSRYSGCWIGMKLISDTVESAASVSLDDEERIFVLPEDFDMPADGLNLRWPDDRWSQDKRLQNLKPFAALAFARANRVDYTAIASPDARFGIVASGKAYEDVRQALRELGLNAQIAAEIGMRVYKVGMPWPLEPVGIRAFTHALREVLVVEERREIIEYQIKQHLFNQPADNRPRIIGKTDENHRPLLPLSQEIDVFSLAEIIGQRLLNFDMREDTRNLIKARLRQFQEFRQSTKDYHAAVVRTPYFCAGCPHNISTRVPEGSRALGGIGCHFMVQWMHRRTDTFSQMGGEGVGWAGIAPFSDEKHIFSNLGDGTYFHSGILAIRQAVSAKINITYKILFNDAVAMTGGQAVDGSMTIPQLVHQLQAENVSDIVIVSDSQEEIKAYDFGDEVACYHRDAIDSVMLKMREIEGCSVMIYHQRCAAEKRRMRKRKTYAPITQRVYIHPRICENCGDCSEQSNCIAIEPLETDFGRKRRINQTSCNADLSCVKGFCPSFVTIESGTVENIQQPHRARLQTPDFSRLPPPPHRPLSDTVNIAISGIGGTGVLTIGNIIGMGAHLEGKAFMALDVSGLAQKGGAVLSHVRIGKSPEQVATARIASAAADVLLSADHIVSLGDEIRILCNRQKTKAVLSQHLTPTADFIANANFDFKHAENTRMLKSFCASEPFCADFQKHANEIFGDAIFANMMILGAATQKGWIPVSTQTLKQAIGINGISVDENLVAFEYGRMFVFDYQACGLSPTQPTPQHNLSRDLPSLIEARSQELRAYHNAAYAKAYKKFITSAQTRIEQALGRSNADQSEILLRLISDNYYKLLAFKDEFEVARLYSLPEFQRDLEAQFGTYDKIQVHLSPPLWARRDKNSGRPRKYALGSWVLKLMRGLKTFRFLRFTPLNIFAYQADRRLEMRLPRHYRDTIDECLGRLTPQNVDIAMQIAAYPDTIRGFGFVKQQSLEKAKEKLRGALNQFFC